MSIMRWRVRPPSAMPAFLVMSTVILLGLLQGSHARPLGRSRRLNKPSSLQLEPPSLQLGVNSTNGTRSKGSTYYDSTEVDDLDDLLDQLANEDKDEEEQGLTAEQRSRRRRWWRPNLPLLQRRRRRRRQAMQKRMLSTALQQDQPSATNATVGFGSADPLSTKLRRQSSRLLGEKGDPLMRARRWGWWRARFSDFGDKRVRCPDCRDSINYRRTSEA